MPNPNPVQNSQLKKCQYKAQGDTLSEPLDKKDTQIVLRADVAKAVKQLPNRSAWLRRVITNAAIRRGLIQPSESE